MNVLILTPDAVGSTLLQRFITIYMQFYNFGRPVINLHELTNGLERYWSSDFNQEIVSKHHGSVWGYHQSLHEVTELLSSVDHYKVSRLAQYHLRRRQDPISDQLPFYRYLDENFFIIACRRKNVFEHALSWSLNRITKKLNVYSVGEKCSAFWDLYSNPVDVDIKVFAECLENYRHYLQWSTDHFSVASYFEYEKHVPRLEQYILDLPLFSGRGDRVTWKDKFGIDLHEWNRVHNLKADIGKIALDHPELLVCTKPSGDPVIDYQRFALPQWPAIQSQEDFGNLPAAIQQEFAQRHVEHYDIQSQLPAEQQQFLSNHLAQYDTAMRMIHHMQQLDILISPPPIKKQTLREKRHIIKNFRQCLDYYNQWIEHHPEVGSIFTEDDVRTQDQTERNIWHAINVDTTSFYPQDLAQLRYQNDVRPEPNQLDDKV